MIDTSTKRPFARLAPWLPVALICALFGCAAQEQPAQFEPPSEPASESDRASAASPTTPEPSSPRARVVTVNVSVSVDDASEAVERLRRFVEARGGHVERADLRATERASLLLRLPADELSAARAELRELGEVTSEQETVRDVTGQRADLGARVRNAEAHEQRLLTVLAEETGTLADILTVEQELSRVREQIERMEAQERTLSQRIAYARLEVELLTPLAAVARAPRFWEAPAATIANAATVGVNFAWAIVVGVVALIAALGPSLGLFGLVLALLYATAKLLWRRRRRASAC